MAHDSERRFPQAWFSYNILSVRALEYPQNFQFAKKNHHRGSQIYICLWASKYDAGVYIIYIYSSISIPLNYNYYWGHQYTTIYVGSLCSLKKHAIKGFCMDLL